MDRKRGFALTAAAVMVFAACTPAATTAPASQTPASVAPAAARRPERHPQPPASAAATAASVRLQLQWAPQAQFAGYFAADKQGYYKAENLTVDDGPGRPDGRAPGRGLKPNGPEFTISWVPKVLEAREASTPSDLVDIAQVFQRSGTLSVTWKADADRRPVQARRQEGRRLGLRQRVRGHGRTADLRPDAGPREQRRPDQAVPEGHPGLRHEGVPGPRDQRRRGDDLQRVRPGPRGDQPRDGRALQAGRPRRRSTGTTTGSRCSRTRSSPARRGSPTPANRDVAVRFVRASLKGWIYCRDHPDDCVQYSTDAGSQLGAGHQKWMMNEVNALVWPSPLGVGMIDPVFWQQTVKVAKNGRRSSRPTRRSTPTRPTSSRRPSKGITDDTNGKDFKKGTVEVTAGRQLSRGAAASGLATPEFRSAGPASGPADRFAGTIVLEVRRSGLPARSRLGAPPPMHGGEPSGPMSRPSAPPGAAARAFAKAHTGDIVDPLTAGPSIAEEDAPMPAAAPASAAPRLAALLPACG